MKLSAKESVKWVMIISFVAGTTDGLAAVLIYQADPIKLFQMIASGIVGRENAFNGGLSTFALGLSLHYLIATAWTIFFFVLYDKFQWLRKHRIGVVIGYGLFVWAIMNLVVVPISKVGRPMPNFNQFLLGAAILVFAISLPIVLLTARANRSTREVSKASV